VSSRRCLLVFTKPARPGKVKTRLVGELTAIQAAALHAAFLSDLLNRMQQGRFDIRVWWSLAPNEALPPVAVASFRQQGDSLGERLLFALRVALEEYPLAAVIGSDHPDLDLERIESGFALLESGRDLVLGPAPDGGFYFIGAGPDGLQEGLFDGVAWSTGTVYRQVVQNARSLDIDVSVLREAPDVDTAEDLARLAVDLAADPGLAPRTHRLLSAWGRLPVGTNGEVTR